MKKLVSLLLALVMTLSLCVPAYAGSTAGTVALRLTGSAADQVANLKSGQRVATDNDVVVRLNVQSDPAAAEYAVALNGEAVAADHSTSQYHFYYLPAAQLSAGTATLSVETADALTGEGTAESPYKIYTAAQLAAFRDKVNASKENGAWATLMNNISISGYWTPIGTADKPYTGTFDGDGRTISGLNVNAANNSDGDSAGLFGVAGEGAAIKNLTISSGTVAINKAGYAGALIGRTKGAVTLTNCHTADGVTVQAAAATASSVGGLVGYSEGGLLTMTACSNAAIVTGGAASANKGTGGLVGQAAAAFSIQQSFNAGSVSSAADSNVGGLVGYASGTVTAASALTDVYSAGAVSGTAGSSVGGFIGKVDGGFVFDGVTNAYIRAAVTAGEGTGAAIVGSAEKDIPLTNVYKLNADQDEVGSRANSDDAGVKKENELKALAVTLGENWTDDTEAALNGGFPILKWQADGSVEKPVALEGSGTADYPYRIPDAAALGLLRDMVNESASGTAFYAKLTEDITLTGSWTAFQTFTGVLDGQNHTISGIQIDAEGTDQGLISLTKGDVTIKNLTIADSSIAVSQTRAGAFVGKADDDNGVLTLENCHTAADVTVSARNGIAGGLVGQTAGTVTITSCSNRAAVTSTDTMNGIGGLVGHVFNGSGRTLTVSQSFNAGAVTGGKYTGGLVGQVSNDACPLTMTDVYNVGEVSTSASGGAAGSLIGYLPKGWGNQGATTITNAYSASANALLGALDAGKPTTLTNVYVLSGQTAVGTLAEGASLTGEVTGKTADEMKENAFGKKALGVSFTRDFQTPQINNGYPVLKWQNGDKQEPVTLTGTGMKNDPYQLYDASDLAAFRDIVNSRQGGACAILMDDIDLRTENFTRTWTPIGTLDRKYGGTFDGNGHTIRGIRIQNTSDEKFYAGLFGWTVQSTTTPVIKNLTIADSTIINEVGDAGGILCFGGGVMENCHTTATVTVKGSNTVGGLVGIFKATYAEDHPIMTNCSNRAAVTQINESTVVSAPRVGGLIGYPYSVVMTGCFNAGTVSAETANGDVYMGGLIGFTDQGDSTLTDVYNVGSVTAPNSATTSIGGLVGHARRGLDIKNAYQCGTVANKDGKGGIVGYFTSGSNVPMLLLNVYKTGGLADLLEKEAGAKVSDNKGIDVTEEQLKGFTSELGMSFVADLTGDKQLNNGRPILEWQDPAATDSDFLYIAVKDLERKVRLSSNGNTDPESPTLCQISIDNSQLSTNLADTIYLAVDNSKHGGDIKVGTGLDKTGLTGVLTAAADGTTADGLYFAKHPAQQTRTVYVAYTQPGDETRYYRVDIIRSARSGVAYGANLTDPATSEDKPYTASTYDETTGYLTGAVDAGYQQFTNGELSNENTFGISTAGNMAGTGVEVSVKDEDGTQNVAFARPGRYWVTSNNASTTYDTVPLAAWWGSAEVAQKYLDKANALKEDASYAKLPDALKTDFEATIAEIDAEKGSIAEPLPGRDALGAPMTKEYGLEKAENHLLNLMDIIGKADIAVAADKYTALTRLEEKLEIRSVLEITDEAGLTAYNTNRTYIRTMMQAADRDGINAVLKNAKCETITGGAYEAPVTEVTLWIGNDQKTLAISGEGSTDPASPTAIAIDTAIPADGRMERVSFTLPDSVQAGTGLDKSKGALSGALVQVEGKYTAESLYFYDQAAAKSHTAYLVYTEGDTNHYYKVTVSRPAKTGLNISSSGWPNDINPIGLDYDTMSSARSYAQLYVYDGAVMQSGIGPVAPKWSTDPTALIYAEDTGDAYSDKVYVKRHGWYWMPVSHETASGYLPMESRMIDSAAAKYIAAASALADSAWYNDIPTEAKKMMTDAIAAVQAQIDDRTLNSNVYMDSGNKIKQRNYFGGPLHGTDQVEQEANTILDLTAIFTTWGANAELAGYQWQAYQQIMAMPDAIHSVLGIASAEDRDSYQALRQAKWDLLQAADVDGVNAVLTQLGLETIATVTTVEIGSAAELKAFRDRVNGGETALHARLTADIDLNNEAWTPIGTSGNMYTGTFNGAGHTISGLNVTGANNGLFTMTGDGATIQNLTISNSTIGVENSTSNLLGAFVGRIKGNTTLFNCHTTSDVKVFGGAVGGLVGGSDTANATFTLTMERCSNAATVTGKAGSYQMGVGGLVGVLHNGGTITDSCNTGTVTNGHTGSSAAAGGLVGSVYNRDRIPTALTLTNVYNTGAVSVGGSTSEYVGGLVGYAMWGFTMTNAYSTMSVMRGTAYGGVIAGTVNTGDVASNVYMELRRDVTNANLHCKAAISDIGSKLAKAEKMWSDTEMPVAEKVLNNLGAAFKQDTDGSICGYVNYPVLAWQEAPVKPVTAQLTVTVNGVKKTLTLDDTGSTDAANPTALTVDYTNAEGSGYMDRIYVDGGEDDIQLGTTLEKDGTLSNALVKLDAGYTGDSLYFYKTPQAMSKKTFKAVWTVDGTARYYTVDVTRAAQPGLALGPCSNAYDANPKSAGASNGYDGNGFLKTMAWFIAGSYSMRYDGQNVYMDGTEQSGKTAVPDWETLKTQSNGMYFADSSGYAYFARTGRYWLPVSYTEGETTLTGYAPFYVRLGVDGNFKYYIDKADALDKSAMPAEAQTMLKDAIDTVNAARSAVKLNDVKLALNAKGEYVTAGAADSVGITGRDFFGADLYAESLYEQDINTIMDLTDIFRKEDTQQAGYQWQAYQQIMNMSGAIHKALDIKSAADLERYQTLRQAKWDLLQATDLNGVNAILTDLGLTAIEAPEPPAPEYTLGDVNNDGKIDSRDIIEAIRFYRGLKEPTDVQRMAMDVNGDGKLDSRDIIQMIRYYRGLIPELTNPNT